MKALGIEAPDFDLFVSKLHENKGPQIGGYITLGKEDTEAIYRLAAE